MPQTAVHRVGPRLAEGCGPASRCDQHWRLAKRIRAVRERVPRRRKPCAAGIPSGLAGIYFGMRKVYTALMTKRLIDVDDEALDAARAKLSTLSEADLGDRSAAWR